MELRRSRLACSRSSRASCSAVAARADSLDDTLARFLADKFPQTRESGRRAGRRGAAAGDRDSRSASATTDCCSTPLTISSPTRRRPALSSTPRPASRSAESVDAFKKVRVNNALRVAIEGAMGSLTLASSDPEKRLAAARDVFKTRDAKALPAVEAQLAKESDPERRHRLRLARAAIFATSASASPQDRLAADRDLEGSRRRGRAEPHGRPGAAGDGAGGQELPPKPRSPRSTRGSPCGAWRRTSGTGSRRPRFCCWRRSALRSLSASWASSIWRTAKW